ncbi:hypothetical protein Bca4012_031160 [Brassica carinata]
MGIKTYYNLAEDGVDAIADFVKGILPEDNVAPGSYYEVQKLVAGLGLSCRVIDVCGQPHDLLEADEQWVTCKFCGKPRYKDTSGRIRCHIKGCGICLCGKVAEVVSACERTKTTNEMACGALSDGEIGHPSIWRGSISNQSIPTLRMREEMSTLDYVSMVSAVWQEWKTIFSMAVILTPY